MSSMIAANQVFYNTMGYASLTHMLTLKAQHHAQDCHNNAAMSRFRMMKYPSPHPLSSTPLDTIPAREQMQVFHDIFEALNNSPRETICKVFFRGFTNSGKEFECTLRFRMVSMDQDKMVYILSLRFHPSIVIFLLLPLLSHRINGKNW